MTFLVNVTCPHCKDELPLADGTDHNDPPQPGHFSICIRCYEVSVFDDKLQLRAPTEAEAAEIAADFDIQNWRYELRLTDPQVTQPKSDRKI